MVAESYWQHAPTGVQQRVIELAELFARCRAIDFDLVDDYRWPPSPAVPGAGWHRVRAVDVEGQTMDLPHRLRDQSAAVGLRVGSAQHAVTANRRARGRDQPSRRPGPSRDPTSRGHRDRSCAPALRRRRCCSCGCSCLCSCSCPLSFSLELLGTGCFWSHSAPPAADLLPQLSIHVEGVGLVGGAKQFRPIPVPRRPQSENRRSAAGERRGIKKAGCWRRMPDQVMPTPARRA
jgi:hypothetical protein